MSQAVWATASKVPIIKATPALKLSVYDENKNKRTKRFSTKTIKYSC